MALRAAHRRSDARLGLGLGLGLGLANPNFNPNPNPNLTKGNKGEAEGGGEKPSRAERLASAFAVAPTAVAKRKFAMS